MATNDSSVPTSKRGSARSKPRKQPDKITATRNQGASGKSPKTRLVKVPLQQIRLPPESNGATRALAPLQLRGLNEKHAALMALTMLPVLTQDGDDASSYHVLGHERFVRWIKHWVDANDLAQDAICALVVDDFDVSPGEARLVEEHLLPLALGLLSRKQERAARKALKAGGIPLPRRCTVSEQLRPLVNRPTRAQGPA